MSFSFSFDFAAIGEGDGSGSVIASAESGHKCKSTEEEETTSPPAPARFVEMPFARDVGSTRSFEVITLTGRKLQHVSASAHDVTLAELPESFDVVPGRYEGGFKIWECSLDLVDFLFSSFGSPSSHKHKPRKVLELGCGHGLPGCAFLSLRLEGSTVLFSDLNAEVLEQTTWPNVAMNCPDLLDRVQCVCGDWLSLSNTILGHEDKFDLILSAETLYTSLSCQKVLFMLENHLSSDGVALLATKRHYFGLGGGTREFEVLVSGSTRDLLCCSVVKSFEDGQSNIRDIIRVTHKKSSEKKED